MRQVIMTCVNQLRTNPHLGCSLATIPKKGLSFHVCTQETEVLR
jgi:hypothetical protein